MKTHYYYIGCAFLILLASCSNKLDDTELEIIHNDIPSEIYQETASQMADELDDYIMSGIEEYSETIKSKVVNDMQEYSQATAIFGDWDIGAAVFGEPTHNEKLVDRFNSYIDYVNRKRQTIYETIKGETEIIAKNPAILNSFAGIDDVNLEVFSPLEFIPSSISRESYTEYYSIPFSKTDMQRWGEAVLPYSKQPAVQFDALTVAVIKMMRNITYPTPVYAVYNKEEKAWNVGYDTRQAFYVTFTTEDDVVVWEMEETVYSEAYINSKGNVLFQ